METSWSLGNSYGDEHPRTTLLNLTRGGKGDLATSQEMGQGTPLNATWLNTAKLALMHLSNKQAGVMRKHGDGPSVCLSVGCPIGRQAPSPPLVDDAGVEAFLDVGLPGPGLSHLRQQAQADKHG